MSGKETPGLKEARQRLIEAEDEFRRSQNKDYVTRVIRDSAVVDAHRHGMSTKEIEELVEDLNPDARAVARREVVPGGFLSPVDAIRTSGLGPKDFMRAIRDRGSQPVEVNQGILAFRTEDILSISSRAPAS